MKSFLHSPLLLALFSFILLQASPLFGQATTEKVKKIPFHGKIVALDQGAKTITLNGKSARVLHVLPETKLIDGSGSPTTFSIATVGEAVSGSYAKETMGLFSLRIGAKGGSKEATESDEAPAAAAAAPAAAATPAPAAAAAEAPAKMKKGSFSGKVTAVDAAGGTFSIKTRTFKVDGSTKITDSTGTASSLAGVTVGGKVSGSYEKAADGTMTAATLKIAK